jgi:transposase
MIVLVGVQAGRIAELVAANEDLAVRLARVEHLLSRNSRNSSSPPSKDDDVGRTGPEPVERRGTGRSKGKRPGAAGSHLAFTESPDDRVDRFPEGCECGHDLAGAADLGVVDRYQETEIPLVVATVTQFDQHAVRCRCGKVHSEHGLRSGAGQGGPRLVAMGATPGQRGRPAPGTSSPRRRPGAAAPFPG